IARHSQHESVRRSAFDALHDEREIVSVALNSEFRDPTLAAVERVADRRDLEQIAGRAKNKSASKRARTILREIDERETREREEAAAAVEAERRARLDEAEAAQAAGDAQ